MRFHLDQDVDVELAFRLRKRAHSALTAPDAGSTSLSNGSQLDYAASVGRVPVTHNRRHFRRLHKQWQSEARKQCAIVISRHMNTDELERRLLRFAETVDEDVVAGELFSLADCV